MARALKLVLSSDPRHHTAQVCAHSIDAVALNAGGIDDQVGGVTLEALEYSSW